MNTEPENERIESEVKRMLGESEPELDNYISEHEDAYSGNLADFAFREAIRSGNTEYVYHHAEDFDLNDCYDYSSYLYETDDIKMQQALIELGACRSWDEYTEFRFAAAPGNDEVIAFTPEFQREVYEKYKADYKLSDEQIYKELSPRDTDCEGEDCEDEGCESAYDICDRFIDDDMSVLGITAEDGKLKFDPEDVDARSLMELLEEIGWECESEGEDWESSVYFIR